MPGITVRLGLVVVALSAFATGCVGGPGRPDSPLVIRTPVESQTSWERTDTLYGRPREHSVSSGMEWSLAVAMQEGRACWMPTVEEGPSVMMGIGSDSSAYCTEPLDVDAAPFQVTFVQASDSVFAKLDDAQVVSGAVDDRLTSVEFLSRTGQRISTEVESDGTFFIRLPLAFEVDLIELHGLQRVVTCEGGPVDRLASRGECDWYG